MSAEEPTLVHALAAMMAGVRERDLPEEVRASVRRRVLDILGICVAASLLPTSEAVTGFVTSSGGTAEAHAVGVEGLLPAQYAALVNGTLAHSLDFDDTHLPSVLHPSATIVPTCLAVAEAVGASGAEAVSAVGVGLEACVRLGMAGYDRDRRNSTYFDRGQHATSICGAIAGAGAAAMLMGMDQARIADAMAIAVSMAGGVIEANRTGGTVKRVHCGWAAHVAVSAAGLARAGITGPPTVLEGRFGFFRGFLDGHYEPDAITDGLGERWAVPGIYFKPYPANHFTHAAIDAALALRAKGVRPEEVERLVLGVPAPVLHTVGEPIEIKRAPETGYQAQFSGPYVVAAALLGGGGLGLGLGDFTDELARDPRRRALMAKVEVVADEECSALFPDSFPARLEAWTAGGEYFVEMVRAGRGGPERPLSDSELAAKFDDNVSGLLSHDAAVAVREAVRDLEAAASVEACIEPLATKLGVAGSE